MSSSVIKSLQLWSNERAIKCFGAKHQCVILVGDKLSPCTYRSVWVQAPSSLQTHKFVCSNQGHYAVHYSRNWLTRHVFLGNHYSWLGGSGGRQRSMELGTQCCTTSVLSGHRRFRIAFGILVHILKDLIVLLARHLPKAKCSFHISLQRGGEG